MKFFSTITRHVPGRRLVSRALRYRPRSRFERFLLRRPRRDTDTAPYAVLSADPAILYTPYWIDDRIEPAHSLAPVYEHLKKRPAWFLMDWMWCIENPLKIRGYASVERAHLRRYPHHHFVHLCNTTRQLQLFLDHGLDAVFCNQNCFVDESIYRPLPGVARSVDAVYDARFLPYKRHHLAAKVESLGLLYAFDPSYDTRRFIDSTRKMLPHAHYFNHPDGTDYTPLPREQVNVCLNRARTGLCLSGTEGAMYASMQYLLAGLPIVSTHSEGGRDVFFDERFVELVPADPAAVASAVRRLVREAPPAEFIRRETLQKVAIHRHRFIDLVQRIYDAAGAGRSFADEWPGLFFDKLHHAHQRHDDAIAQLDGRAAVR